ncbi:uncharacterized protein LOC130533410 [Takifugu flavidus]|uniref:uncharacterized protein LOC130533410 n=1 Tax=Takifugu flavidus TaxID=433684 RepID=UPI002543FC19|nr:uncharacterized protein LOC130533410 [Takifugu flavidus]
MRISMLNILIKYRFLQIAVDQLSDEDFNVEYFNQVPNALQIAVDQLSEIPISIPINLHFTEQNENVLELDTLQLINDALENLNAVNAVEFENHSPSSALHTQSDHVLHAVTIRSETDSAETQSALPNPPPEQDERPGEGGSESSPSPHLSPQQGGGGLGENPSDLSPERGERFFNDFNAWRTRRSFNIPTRGNVPDIATFYRDVTGVISELVDVARRHSSRNDLIQLEVVGENVHNHVTVAVDEQGENILPAFNGMLDRIVQSNGIISSDENIEFILHVVQNPGGGAKRKMEKTLDCEIIDKKRRHLFIVDNRDNQLCFAISLAHVIYPKLTERECLDIARKLQHQAGLNDETPVTFSDIGKFENILGA